MDTHGVEGLVRNCIAAALDVHVDFVTLDVSLIELGADSFQYVSVRLRLEEVFGVRLPDHLAIPGAQVVADYVAQIESCVRTVDDCGDHGHVEAPPGRCRGVASNFWKNDAD